ncbi:MAG: DUF3795 domain-containing protein [Gammaproteobacteria bacterium]|nr:DUF3795 domain-containing protein [Gammaproteobacteria bacterium]
MIAYCGLDCSKCIGLIATKSGSKEELEKVAKIWSIQFDADIKPEHIVCEGCKGPGRKSHHCNNLCKIRACCISKNFQSCIECKVYPCEDLRFVLDNAPEAKNNLEKLVEKS